MSKLPDGSHVYIETAENYQKQSFRNRCYIYGANGVQPLVIPVLKGNSKIKITETRIDNGKKWQRIHWKAIESAYRLSPYFEFYADEIGRFYNIETEFLFEWDLSLLKTVAGILGINTEIRFTGSFMKPENMESGLDYRNSIHPKERLNKADPFFNPKPYQQVFSNRHGFIPDLSIIDLVFNEGPYAMQVLRESCRRTPR